MKIHILGCNGWIPGKNETSCFLLEQKDKLIMLDAGTGVSNLKKYRDVLEKYDSISIILTHYHLDHIIGLTYLLPFIDGKRLDIYGPGIPVYEKTTEGYLKELLQTAFFSRPLETFSSGVHCYDYAGRDFSIGKVKINVKQQQHSSPSYQLGIDGELIYATDTFFDMEEWRGRSGGKLLLHECWEINTDGKEKHTSLEKLISGIPREQFDTILLIHHNPEWCDNDYEIIYRRIKGMNIQIAEDGMLIEI